MTLEPTLPTLPTLPTMLVASFAAVLIGTSACSTRSVDPIQLDRNMLTVDNRTSSDWSNVEIWINTYFRITTQSIAAGGRFQAPLDAAVAGFGQRFDFKRMQVKDVRLVARLPDGKPYEVKKQFRSSDLAGALGGKR